MREARTSGLRQSPSRQDRLLASWSPGKAREPTLLENPLSEAPWSELVPSIHLGVLALLCVYLLCDSRQVGRLSVFSSAIVRQ